MAALKAGKLPPDLLAELLSGLDGSIGDEVLLGPRPGEDACAIEVPEGVLVVAADPITLTGADVGAHAVTVNANDVAVMGVAPRWFLATVMLPLGADEAQVRQLFERMRAALSDLGASLVGGHTEITPAVNQPVIAGQMLGMASEGDFIRTAGARPGDLVLQVGPAPVEGAAVLAAEAGPRLASLPPDMLEAASRAADDPGISIVGPALAAARLGARAMHDPTEGGLATGLAELANASGLQLVVRESHIAWFEPGTAVCTALGADPWGTLASGTLLAVFPERRADHACDELAALGFEPHVIAQAQRGSGVLRSDGQTLPTFARDEVARVLEETSL